MNFADLTDKKRRAITLDVLNKTSFLKLAEHNELDNNSHRSLEHVKRFLEIPEEDLADDLLATFDSIRGSFNVAIQGTSFRPHGLTSESSRIPRVCGNFLYLLFS